MCAFDLLRARGTACARYVLDQEEEMRRGVPRRMRGRSAGCVEGRANDRFARRRGLAHDRKASMIEKICMVLIFVGVAVGVGIYCRRTTRALTGSCWAGATWGRGCRRSRSAPATFRPWCSWATPGSSAGSTASPPLWAGIGNAILGSLLAWWVLGPRTREMTHRLGASTMPEFFGARYRSKGLRIAAAAIIFVFLIPYTASVYNGLSRLFGMAFGLPYEVCVIGMAAVTCIYVVVGGYMATVMNDFHAGHRHVAGHCGGHRGGAGEQRRLHRGHQRSFRSFRPRCPPWTARS